MIYWKQNDGHMNLLKVGGRLSIIIAIIIFGLLVLFHELGHFLLAKKNGIKVDEFSIGMGPKIWHIKKGETDYCIKLLPLGGSCMMAGEDEESTDENAFNKKSVWARISVVLAGPVFNFILAFFLAVFISSVAGIDSPVLTGISENSGAEAAQLQAGDKIIKLNNTKIHIFSEISLFLQTHPSGKSVNVTYERDGETNTVEVTPTKTESGGYLFGFSGGRQKGNLLEIIKSSYYTVIYYIKAVIQSLVMLVTGQVNMNQLSGPVGIVKMIGDTYEQAQKVNMMSVVLSLANFSSLLSANLGIMNLLPIPALDGGRLVFLFFEAIFRRKLSSEKEGMVHFVGFCVLMALMVFLFANDIRTIFL